MGLAQILGSLFSTTLTTSTDSWLLHLSSDKKVYWYPMFLSRDWQVSSSPTKVCWFGTSDNQAL